MKKNLTIKAAIISILVLLLNFHIFSQDILFKKNGEELKAKVLEVGVSEIKFKHFDYQDGPTIIIEKSELFFIKYENGRKEIFQSTVQSPIQSNEQKQLQPPIAGEQEFYYDDIFKTDKVFFFGYDFTKAKVIESSNISNEQSFIFGIIQFMNDTRNDGHFSRYLGKQNVMFTQNTVNQLNSKIPKGTLIGLGMNVLGDQIPKDSLQGIVNWYDTRGMSGIGFVQIIDHLYKSTKETSVWFVFFDISSKKILDAFKTSNNDADSWHGYSAYWSVGLRSGLGYYISKHYKFIKKLNVTKNK